MADGRFKTIFITFSIAIIGSLVSGTWIGWSSPANYLIKNNKTELAVIDFGMMVAMYDLGNIISPIPTGYALSLIGRKMTISTIGPLNALSWTALLVWPSSLRVLFAARFAAGMAKGMAFSAIPLYVGEISEVQFRGTTLSIFPIMLTTGMLLMQMVGQTLTYHQLNWFGLSFSIMFTVLFLAMPESPYYHVQNKQRDRAQNSLKRIRAKDDVEDELNVIEETINRQMQNKTTYGELFKNKGNRRAFIITAGACAAQRLSGVSPFIHFSSITLPSTDVWINPMLAVVIFSMSKNVGNIVTMAIVDWLGRKPLMIFSHLMMGLCSAVYAGSLYAMDVMREFGPYAWIPVVVLWLFGLSYGLGAGSLSSTLMGEMFAVNVKTKAAPLCVVFLAFGSFFLDGMYTVVTESLGVFSNYALYSVFNIVWVLIALCIMIETKGKTFLEIQQLLNINQEPSSTP